MKNSGKQSGSNNKNDNQLNVIPRNKPTATNGYNQSL